MRKIDELYLENPSSGSRTIRRQLEASRHDRQPKADTTADALMGIEAVYPKPGPVGLTHSTKFIPICCGI
jgi:hypothetical protein